MQVGGILCSRRVEEVENHVFSLSSRINSTWGGGLVDMVRATRILEVIEEEELVKNAEERGRELLAGLQALADDFPGTVSNPRGRGLIAAFDLPDAAARAGLRAACHEEKVLVLACGERSIRLRPALNVTAEELTEGLARIRAGLGVRTNRSLFRPSGCAAPTGCVGRANDLS